MKAKTIFVACLAVALLPCVPCEAAEIDVREWPLDGSLSEAGGNCPLRLQTGGGAAAAFETQDGRTSMRLKDASLTANGEAMLDLAPGLVVSVRMRLSDGERRGTIIAKGRPQDCGAYFLRIDPAPEPKRFSFFANVDGFPDPRVSSPVPVRAGEWYDLAAGWDGTNIWISVNGQTTRTRRRGEPFRCSAPLRMGPFDGHVERLRVAGTRPEPSQDTPLASGLHMECRIVFDAMPKGETYLVGKSGEYMLRYDEKGGKGSFNFFVLLDGRWESRVSCPAQIELGHPYCVVAGWDGMQATLHVDGRAENVWRSGAPTPGRSHVTRGSFKGRVDRLLTRRNRTVNLRLSGFRTAELMPTGPHSTLLGTLRNLGTEPLADCTVTATAPRGVKVTPERVCLGMVTNGAVVPLSWRVDAGTNMVPSVSFSVQSGGRRLANAWRRIAYMPESDPDFASRTWQPPIHATRTFHIDAQGGDDTRDGLTPETAWRTFANAARLTLGPGERLLLKRGSVFNEELVTTARGLPENWAEIGAYGSGPRPTIRRRRDIDDRCAFIRAPSHLVVRDLVLCNAGKGLDIVCGGEGACRGVLVERCLAHHIEGLYRLNSHGIPEWRDRRGAPGSGLSGGIGIQGADARQVVMRDCEMYQCSNGFRVNGRDVVLLRNFCHDSFCHNTSPHPFLTSTLRAWLLDSVFDAAGWSASAGTMGIMLGNNEGLVIRSCHFLNQPHSGSGDEGGIDFECGGDNCRIERCTFRSNAGAAIEVLGLRSPQARCTHIVGCRFDRNNTALKLGPSEIFVWGGTADPEVVCSSGLIEGNGCVLAPGVRFYTNMAVRTWKDWTLRGNRTFADSAALDRAFPLNDPPQVDAGAEMWCAAADAVLDAKVADDGRPAGGGLELAWEQLEGPAVATLSAPAAARTAVRCPAPGDYRFLLKADDGELWRTGRTAVHILPPGSRVARAWTFARNLDAEGWAHGDLGTAREEFRRERPIDSTFADPVHLVCGDYYVLALKDAVKGHLLSPDGLGLAADATDALVVRMQNHTGSTRMRVSFTTEDAPEWDAARSRTFAVTPQDEDDRVYRVPLAFSGKLKRLRLDFSADGSPVTGTCRIDYIWLGRAPERR